MTRFLIGSVALMLVLSAYQWHGLRAMKVELEQLHRDAQAESKRLALQQFTPERHDEVQRALTWLDDYSRAREGLRRPQGLCVGGQLDAPSVTVWLFDSYLHFRVDGDSEGMAREKVLRMLEGSGEWHAAHAGT